MSSAQETAALDLFAHPDVRPLFGPVLNSIVGESDRGAVLVAAAHVDVHLRKLFEGVAPDTMSPKLLKQILNYPGALHSLAARADVAYLTRLIDQGLYNAITNLRRIRNEVAHAPSAFRLREPFSRKDFEIACPGFAIGTYSAFLNKRRVGNQDGTSELFEKVAPGRFRCGRPFRYGC